MEACLFLLWEPHDRARLAELSDDAASLSVQRAAVAVERWYARSKTVTQIAIHTPTHAEDRYIRDVGSPQFTLQLYFDDLRALERAAGPDGEIHGLVDDPALRALEASAPIRPFQQAMMVRRYFPLDGMATAALASYCTYQVSYYAADPASPVVDVWLSDYIAQHVPLLRMQPALLALEVYTRVDWLSTLGLQRAQAVQRNKAVFANPEQLTAALNSPVRDALHRHSMGAPKLQARNTHFPMRTVVLSRHASVDA